MIKHKENSADYKKKKAFYNNLLTIYGRKPALEALEAPDIKVLKLHLSDRNKPAEILDRIIKLAESGGAEVCYHSAKALSRISKNAKQDQGVAVDLQCPHFQTLEEFLSKEPTSKTIIALDRVTNPQNLGIIIRSVAASSASALIVPLQGCAPLNSLVIKASAGAIFKAPLVRVESLQDTLKKCREKGFRVATLELSANQSALEHKPATPTIYVLGNETDGVSQSIAKLGDLALKIPMQRNVESLNVAVTASLIAFSQQ